MACRSPPTKFIADQAVLDFRADRRRLWRRFWIVHISFGGCIKRFCEACWTRVPSFCVLSADFVPTFRRFGWIQRFGRFLSCVNVQADVNSFSILLICGDRYRTLIREIISNSLTWGPFQTKKYCDWLQIDACFRINAVLLLYGYDNKDYSHQTTNTSIGLLLP